MEQIRVMLGYEGMIVVEPQGRSGGLALLWKNSNQASLVSLSQNHIDVHTCIDGMVPWRLTGIYGEPKRSLRRKTWDLLRNLARDSNLPWCVIGDMNNIKSQAEKKGGAVYPSWLVEGFNEAITDTGLQDLDMVGHQFTWERGRNTNNWIQIRLDRGLVDVNWLQCFPLTQLYNTEGSSSDHSLIILEPKNRERRKGKYRFKFENAWLTEPVCHLIVKDSWESNPNDNIMQKVQTCGEHLKSGDKNMKYFHASSSSRRRRNHIHRLRTDQGDWRTWEDGLSELIKDYFQQLFSTDHMQGEEVIECVTRSISAEQNRVLVKDITEEEVKQAVFHMHPDKAPGPDGMTPAFFQKHWSVVGKDVVKMVSNFFLTGDLFEGINETNIVLIPKKKNPTMLTDLRPISLCNVLMKVITKVLANRMKGLLEEVISDTQSAFIPGRLISDNIMISYEIMHYLKRKSRGKEGYMALKLDMSKAYDRIEWEFLRRVLLKMGFDERWVQLVLKCVTTVSYNVIHGEHEIGPILPSRGIRQGDPLSPYLFIICAERLSSLIRKYEACRWLHGIKICRRAPVVSHMLFADDSYLYCKADTEEASKVLELLNVYEKASGQKVNINKSSVFFSSNVIAYNKERVCRVLSMNEADSRSMYLGLPNVLGRNKSVILGFIKDKVKSRIDSWDGRYISRAGKEILVKSVIQSLPSYAMSVFLLPVEINKEIERCLSKFWWQSSKIATRGITWMSWERMSKHKAAGGLGFRNFRDFNLAMLGKQGWRILINPDSLVARLYKARYFENTDFLNATLGHSPSFIWRSILEAKNVVAAGVRWRIGTGTNVKISGQPWLVDTGDPYISTVSKTIGNNLVSSLFCMDRKAWDIDVVRDVFNDRDQRCVLDTLIEEDLQNDVLYWGKEQSGVYSVRSAYKYIQEEKGAWCREENNEIWSRLWKIKAPPKCLNLVWRALSFNLPTSGPETIFHVLVSCPFASKCWHILDSNFQVTMGDDFLNWLKSTLVGANKKKEAMVSVDAAIFAEEGAFGSGLVARDYEGRLVEAETKLHYGMASPEKAEVMAIKEALSWIDRMGWTEVIVESDCLAVVQAIRSTTEMRSRLGVLIKDCRNYIKNSNKVSLYFIKRSANIVAHTLARASLIYPDRRFNRWSVLEVMDCIAADSVNQ
ncbi:uncharacterized protein LOC141673779 [Apium graveolens]|uniref:uncharacterized protein LOC141673779 n=1 Tax=Apium graveolens TaxID=4045 RepID=UPI003D79F60D